MPQIVCSHRAADPCSAVIGDRALLSAAAGLCVCVTARVCVCVCVCQEELHFVYVCAGVFAVHVCVWCVSDGEHKQKHPTLLLPTSLPICLCSVSLHGAAKVKHSKHPIDK